MTHGFHDFLVPGSGLLTRQHSIGACLAWGNADTRSIFMGVNISVVE